MFNRLLSWPYSLQVDGDDLYVGNENDGTISEYNAATGSTINSAVVSGIQGSFSFGVAAVPEPESSKSLAIALGMLGLFALIHRRSNRIKTTV